MSAPWSTDLRPYCTVYEGRLVSFAHFTSVCGFTSAQIARARELYRYVEKISDPNNKTLGRTTSAWIKIASIKQTLVNQGGWAEDVAKCAVEMLLTGPEYTEPLIDNRNNKTDRTTRSLAPRDDDDEEEEVEATATPEKKRKAKKIDTYEAALERKRAAVDLEPEPLFMEEFRNLAERMERAVGMDAVRAYMATPKYVAHCEAAVQSAVAIECNALSAEMDALQKRGALEIETARLHIMDGLRDKIEADLRKELAPKVLAELRNEAKSNHHVYIDMPLATEMLHSQDASNSNAGQLPARLKVVRTAEMQRMLLPK